MIRHPRSPPCALCRIHRILPTWSQIAFPLAVAVVPPSRARRCCQSSCAPLALVGTIDLVIVGSDKVVKQRSPHAILTPGDTTGTVSKKMWMRRCRTSPKFDATSKQRYQPYCETVPRILRSRLIRMPSHLHICRQTDFRDTLCGSWTWAGVVSVRLGHSVVDLVIGT